MLAGLQRFLLVFALIGLVACQKSGSSIGADGTAENLRPLTQSERLEDYDALVATVRDAYGPLKFKEKTRGFDFETLASQMRLEAAAATTDAEFYGVIKMLLTHFQDGHVSMEPGPQTVDRYTVPIYVTPVAGRVLIASFMNETVSSDTGFAVGDEVIAVDGKPPMDSLPTILKYEAMGNDLSNQHMIVDLLRRPAYMTELKPTSPTVTIRVAKADGRVLERDLVWSVRNEDYVSRKFTGLSVIEEGYSPETAELVKGSMFQMGSETPFFATPSVENDLQLVRVKPSTATLAKYGLTDAKTIPDLYAALYRFDGKMILLVRQATYSVEDADARLAWYKAVLDEYSRVSDVLVLDQTHNPGGRITYAEDFVSLFATQETHALVNFLHPDRRWLSDYQEIAAEPSISIEAKSRAELAYKIVEDAYDQGLALTKIPVGISRPDYLKPPADFSFHKPVLLLIDELAGSCGDFVPAMFKANKLATLFGTRTMGLGGNVETVVTLPHSHASVNMTRGMVAIYSPDGVYDLDHPLENNGVTPDISYTHTVDDVRNGYVEYARAFSRAAAALK